MPGQLANPSRKSEINPLADLAGLSVLLKLCLIVFASTLTKPNKPEFLLKISSHAAIHAVMDAKVVSQPLLSNTGKIPELSPDL